ncbi:MAG: cation transporter [Candidatus Aenigmarchaeota archaeon]|nr:cation transporter [Candidatus Aenigmarchaeota archaeon]
MYEKVALIGLIVNIIMAIAKIIIGVISNSFAIIADGLHTTMDIIASGITYLGIIASKKPADKEHPLGHYKAEVIAGYTITIILFLTALWIIYESILSLFSPELIILNYLSFGIVVFSIIINAIMSYAKIYYGKKYDLISLISDGVHSRADVLTSCAVLAGLFLSKYFIYADSFIALLMGFYILSLSFNLGRKATDSLLDVSAGDDVENKIKEIAKNENIELLDLKTQKRGPKISAYINVAFPSKFKVNMASAATKKFEKNLFDSISGIDFVNIQITSHELSESYYKERFGKMIEWQRKGKMHGYAFGPGGYCVCSKCGYKIKHKRGVSCSSMKCPKCNIALTRREDK